MDQDQASSSPAIKFIFIEDDKPRILGGTTLGVPALDIEKVREGDQDALISGIFALASYWFDSADSHLSAPITATGIAMAGDNSRAGMLAAAVDLRKLLCAAPQARKILRDLGFERFLEDIEGK